jgi:hypothetical protein
MDAQTNLLDDIDAWLNRGRAAQAEVNSIIAKADREARRRPRARKSDPQTSHVAAKSVRDKVRWSQQAVLDCFRFIEGRGDYSAGVTDPHWMRNYKLNREDHGWPEQSDSGLRTRRHELVVAGQVESAGEWKGEGGRRFTRWRLKRENT